jgi:biotin/methionine sulfoxide reductase
MAWRVDRLGHRTVGDYAMVALIGRPPPTINVRAGHVRPAITNASIVAECGPWNGRGIGVVNMNMANERGGLHRPRVSCHGELMMIDDETVMLPHSSHWGAFSARSDGEKLVLVPHPNDPAPSPLLQNIPSALRHPARIARPMVRRGWLERGPGASRRRGRDEFVPMDWPEVIALLAEELRRVYAKYGAGAVFGGSYGWASAGRFHHAQSQVHRFLNTLGGYVRSVNTYSAGAASVILPHVLGTYEDAGRRDVLWSDIAQYTDVVLAFGGMAAKNSMVSGGGTSRHIVRSAMAASRARGTRFISVSPQRGDMPEESEAEWCSIIPGTDTALMLALAHTLVVENRHDKVFLNRYCEGYDVFEAYLLGRNDGQPKDAVWASAITGIARDDIVSLAHALPGRRTVITVSHSLQRAEHGEQPVWAAVALAAILGQIGLPGGGFAYSLGALANLGKPALAVPLPTLPQGRNPVDAFIPVARIADMLLKPGEAFDYNGQHLSYPEIRLVYWAGGNPFHHHQDIGRLRAAFARPETIVVHELGWTATARHADIVLPSTMSMERDDLGGAAYDPLLVAMHRLVNPYGLARDDYDIFTDLARQLGVADVFTEGRSSADWLPVLYERTADALRRQGHDAPEFVEFWQRGELELPLSADDNGPMRAFRSNPEQATLRTPSGKIELCSATIAGFGYDDCPGHPSWLPPSDGHGSAAIRTFPLQLIANQPAARLHSQLDFAAYSGASKIHGREPMRIHPADAAERAIEDGDIVRIHNDRGACLAAAVLDDALRPGVVQLATGAWYDPEDAEADNPLCAHGNPNVLTRDVGTSRLSQGCTGQLTCVQVTRFTGNLPPIRAYDPPSGG